MNPDDLSRILDELGQRLGPTGERVFGLAVRYEVTSALVGLTFGIVLGVLPLFCARWVWRHEFGMDIDRDMSRVLSVVLSGLALVLAGLCVGTSLVTLLNPEYAALKGILSAIGGAR